MENYKLHYKDSGIKDLSVATNYDSIEEVGNVCVVIRVINDVKLVYLYLAISNNISLDFKLISGIEVYKIFADVVDF